MNNIEFSNLFDVLLNSYSDIKDFGHTNSTASLELDEYEKSVLLTQAQEEIIISYYTGRTPEREGFENTEEIRRYLQTLVNSYTTDQKVIVNNPISEDSVFFAFPSDLLFIVYESVTLDDDDIGCKTIRKSVIVKPVTYDLYNYLSKNPFKTPNESKVFRLDLKGSNVELVSKYNIDSYFMRYIAKPTPIVLGDFDDVSINGVSTNTECSLHPILHPSILTRAVQLALIRIGATNTK